MMHHEKVISNQLNGNAWCYGLRPAKKIIERIDIVCGF